MDVRLIFIKLFEQHILQRMEQLFLSIISVLTYASDDRFIERLYSWFFVFGAKKWSQTSAEDLKSRRVGLALAADVISSAVESVFADLFSQLCGSHQYRYLSGAWCESVACGYVRFWFKHKL